MGNERLTRRVRAEDVHLGIGQVVHRLDRDARVRNTRLRVGVRHERLQCRDITRGSASDSSERSSSGNGDELHGCVNGGRERL